MAEEIQGGLSAAQPQPEAQPEQSPIINFASRAQKQLMASQAALDERRKKLLDLSAARQSMFDPKLLRLAAGMLAPTKTGSFGESLGYAVSGLAEEQEKEHARQLAEAKLQYELEEQAQKQKQSLLGQQLMSEVLLGRRQPPMAPEGGVPARPTPATAAPTSAIDQLSTLTNDELFALSGVPELKPQVDMILKLREQARKENVKVRIGDQEREISAPEYQNYVNLANAGDWEGLRKWHTKFGFPFNYVKDESAPGGMRPMTAQEQAGASEREKAKFGEQKEYMIPYGGGTRKFPLTPAQYLDFLEASGKGEGDKYINKLFNIKAGAGVTTAGGVPKTREEFEIETTGEKKRVEKRVEAGEATREALFESSRAARQLIQNSDQIIQLAKDPNTKNIFGVFARPDIIGALGTLVTEGARAGNYTISLPSVEKAMRQAGATEEEIKAAAVAARIFAQNELGFRKMFLSGQGSVSNMEGAIIPRFSGDLSDSPGAAQAKAEMTKARAELDAAAARTLREWERRPENAKKNFSDFEDSREYNRLLDAYDAKLKKIMQVHFPGEKFSAAPNRPVGTRSSAPNLEPTQPEGVDRKNKWLK